MLQVLEEDNPQERDALQEAFGDNMEAKVLATVVPSFDNFLSPQSTTTLEDDNNNKTKKREENRNLVENETTTQHITSSSSVSNSSSSLHFSHEEMKHLGLAPALLAVGCQVLFQEFGGPLLVFLDDVQWADANSIDLLKALLLVDQNNNQHHGLSNVFWVIGYRDPDPVSDEKRNDDSTVKSFLDSLRLSPTVAEICVANWDEATVNQYHTATLSMEESETRDLSRVVHRKTKGNPLFCTELVRDLQRNQVLTCMDHKWQWNMTSIVAQTNVSDTLAACITLRLQDVPAEVLRLLQLAACIGFAMDRSLLEQLYHETEILRNRKQEEQTSQSLRLQTRNSTFKKP